MSVATASEALVNAYSYAACTPGRCLAYTRSWLEIASAYPTAASAWTHANRRHPGERNIPAGAPCFWTGGTRGYGHIALSVGDGYVRSTDVPNAGWVRTVPLDWFDNHWPALTYAGWAEDLNTVTLPYLGTPTPPPTPKPPTRAHHGDDMLITRDDNGTLTYWLVSGGRRANIGQGDAATYTGGPTIVVRGDKGWTEIEQNFPTS